MGGCTLGALLIARIRTIASEGWAGGDVCNRRVVGELRVCYPKHTESMTTSESQKIIADARKAYEAAGQPYGTLRLDLLRWIQEHHGYTAHRELEFALRMEVKEMEEV